MKKIICLFSIFFLLSQNCFAADESDENFEQYFQTDTQETEINDAFAPKADNAAQNIKNAAQSTSNTPAASNTDLETTTDTNNYNGSVEYNEELQAEPSEDAIYLGDDVIFKRINFSRPKNISADSLSINKKRPDFNPFNSNLSTASKFTTQEYELGNKSTSLSKQFGNFSFGTKYATSLDSNSQINYTTALFSRYDGKHFAFTTTFLKSTGYDYASYNDKIQIAPELKITNRLSLLDVMKTDVLQINKSNEIVLRYKPDFKKYADDVELELGAGQSFYNDNFVKSSLRFSTNFKL